MVDTWVMEDLDLAAIDRLLTAARTGDPGWSAEFGGPYGVALAADAGAELVTRLVTELIALRTAAVAQLLEEESLRAVARRTGINRSTISKTHRAWDPTLTSFARLTEKEAW